MKKIIKVFLNKKLSIAFASAWGLPPALVKPNDTILLSEKDLSDSTKIEKTGGLGYELPIIFSKWKSAMLIYFLSNCTNNYSFFKFILLSINFLKSSVSWKSLYTEANLK